MLFQERAGKPVPCLMMFGESPDGKKLFSLGQAVKQFRKSEMELRALWKDSYPWADRLFARVEDRNGIPIFHDADEAANTKLMTITEAAEHFKCSEETLYKLRGMTLDDSAPPEPEKIDPPAEELRRLIGRFIQLHRTSIAFEKQFCGDANAIGDLFHRYKHQGYPWDNITSVREGLEKVREQLWSLIGDLCHTAEDVGIKVDLQKHYAPTVARKRK